MKKTIIFIFLLSCINLFSQKDEKKGVFKKIKETFISKEIPKDSILKLYNNKFRDYKFVVNWFNKRPLFLKTTKGNLYKVLKKTIIKSDNSIHYKDFVNEELYQYFFVPDHKDFLYFFNFDIIDGNVELVDLTRIDRGIMYENKYNVTLDENSNIIKQDFSGRVKPFFDVYENHLIFGYKSDDKGDNQRVYFDLGFDIFEEDEKDSWAEYLWRFISLGLTELNKTERIIDNKMLYKL